MCAARIPRSRIENKKKNTKKTEKKKIGRIIHKNNARGARCDRSGRYVGVGVWGVRGPGGRTVVYTAAKVPAGVSETLGCELLTLSTSAVQYCPAIMLLAAYIITVVLK